MKVYQKTKGTLVSKNYNCSLHGFIFWKRCKIFFIFNTIKYSLTFLDSELVTSLLLLFFFEHLIFVLNNIQRLVKTQIT